MEISQENIEVINDFCRETDESLEVIEENITNLKQFIFEFPQDFQIKDYISFFFGLNVDFFLNNIQSINRVVHTIKGVSAFVDLNNTNQYCHTLEELTISIARGELILNGQAFRILEKVPNILNRLLEEIKETYTDESISIKTELEEINKCRVHGQEVMDGRVIHFEELKGKDFGRVRDFHKNLKLNIDLERYDGIVQNFQAFIQDWLNILTANNVSPDLIHELRKGMTEHLDSLISASLSNIVLTRYSRIAKDLGFTLDKNIRLEIKRNEAVARPDIWDKCHNAMVHLVRNSIDHGIEANAEREKLKKDLEGKIKLDIFEDFKNIYIDIEDDGKGLDGDKIAEIAVKKGIVKSEDIPAMTEADKQRLIFKPGFSTKSEATDISGRGVGMDAALREIEINLGGKIQLKSEINKGTKVTLEIPKAETLSECVLFGDDQFTYAVPVVSDIEYLECDQKYLKRIFDKTPIYTDRDLELPILNLMGILHPAKYQDMTFHQMPIIKIGNQGGHFGIVTPLIKGHERLNIDRNKNLKQLAFDEGIVFGYALTNPITVVLDIDYLHNMIE